MTELQVRLVTDPDRASDPVDVIATGDWRPLLGTLIDEADYWEPPNWPAKDIKALCSDPELKLWLEEWLEMGVQAKDFTALHCSRRGEYILESRSLVATLGRRRSFLCTLTLLEVEHER